MRVDTQAHVVSADRERYPLNPPPANPGGVTSRWFDAPEIGVEDLLVRMDGAGIDRAVLVQAYSAYQYDNSYTADGAAAHPDRLACTCIVDVESDAAEAMTYWARDRGARAIRMFVRNASPGWLGSRGCDDVFDHAGRLGVIAQLVASGDDLPALLAVARRHPDVPILVDHCAIPDLTGGDSYPNATTLFALSAAPNVHVKLSNHVFDIAKRAGAPVEHFTQRLVAEFGAARVMWASDYTIHGWDYGTCVKEAEAACAPLSAEDRALVLGDAAARLWWP